MSNDQQEMLLLSKQFLQEHFHVDDGVFAAKHSAQIRGNLRFGFSHYIVGNVNVAVLTGENPRWEQQNALAKSYCDGSSTACYVELYSSAFMIHMIMIVRERSRKSFVSPQITIMDGFDLVLEHFSFSGEIRKARAYFTFARLTK